MTKVSLFAITFIAILSACSSGGLGDSAASNSANYEAATIQTSADNRMFAASNTATASKEAIKTGGGGGGSRQEIQDSQVVKISLDQTAASVIDTAPSDRKIIRNAELNLEAENPEEAQRQITGIAELKGGFVVESQQTSSDIKASTRDIVTMTVRVPASRFSEALTEIRDTASRIVIETVKGQDVTEEFIDIEAQVKTKKALEQQFMEIMKRANTVEDALNVQSQLADVRGDIERVEGRKRFLENQSSLSTIKIRLQTAKVIAAAQAGPGERIAGAFTDGADVALNFILGLVTIIVAVLPFAVFIALPAFVIVRYFWKRQTRPRSVVELAEEELKST